MDMLSTSQSKDRTTDRSDVASNTRLPFWVTTLSAIPCDACSKCEAGLYRACEKGWQWQKALALLWVVLGKQLDSHVISCGAAIVAGEEAPLGT